MQPRNIEEKVYQALAQGDSTHSPFVSRSVGTVVLRDREEYLKGKTADDLRSELMSDLEKETSTALTPKVRSFIQTIIDKQVIDYWDKFFVFVKTPDGSYQDKNYEILLSEILALVWVATKDDQKYTRNYYSRTDEEKDRREKVKRSTHRKDRAV